jgi:hypothetical protein
MDMDIITITKDLCLDQTITIIMGIMVIIMATITAITVTMVMGMDITVITAIIETRFMI